MQSTDQQSCSDTHLVNSTDSKFCPISESINIRYQYNKRIGQTFEKYVTKVPDVHDNVDLDEVRKEQRKDAFPKSMIDLLESNVVPTDKEARKLLLEVNQYFVYDGILYHVWYIPRTRRLPERDIVQLYIPHTRVDTILYYNSLL